MVDTSLERTSISGRLVMKKGNVPTCSIFESQAAPLYNNRTDLNDFDRFSLAVAASNIVGKILILDQVTGKSLDLQTRTFD